MFKNPGANRTEPMDGHLCSRELVSRYGNESKHHWHFDTLNLDSGSQLHETEERSTILATSGFLVKCMLSGRHSADSSLSLRAKCKEFRFSRSLCTQYDQLLARSCYLFVCLSVCDAVHCGEMTHRTASEQVNRKCPPRNTILKLSDPYTELPTPTLSP